VKSLELKVPPLVVVLLTGLLMWLVSWSMPACRRLVLPGRQLVSAPMPKKGSSAINSAYHGEIECIAPPARLGVPPGFAFNFPSIENADTSNLASTSSVETISTPKQIWFTVDVLERQPNPRLRCLSSISFSNPLVVCEHNQPGNVLFNALNNHEDSIPLTGSIHNQPAVKISNQTIHFLSWLVLARTPKRTPKWLKRVQTSSADFS